MDVVYAVARQAIFFIVFLLVFAAAREVWFQLRPTKTRVRFSLRTLFIATTVVAVALGLIAWAAK